MTVFTLPNCLDPDDAPLTVSLREGAAAISISGTDDEATVVVEIEDLQAGLELLFGNDHRRAGRVRAEADAAAERLVAAQREADRLTIERANTRIRELLDLLDQAAAENRLLANPDTVRGALEPAAGDETDADTGQDEPSVKALAGGGERVDPEEPMHPATEAGMPNLDVETRNGGARR